METVKVNLLDGTTLDLSPSDLEYLHSIPCFITYNNNSYFTFPHRYAYAFWINDTIRYILSDIPLEISDTHIEYDISRKVKNVRFKV